MTDRPVPFEVNRLAEHLRKKGVDTVVASSDGLSGELVDSANALIVTMGPRLDDAGDAARVADEAVERNPKIKLIFGMNEVGHDPREIDQIPEARAALAHFARLLKRKTFWCFDTEQRAMMCVALGIGERKGYELHVPQWVLKGAPPWKTTTGR